LLCLKQLFGDCSIIVGVVQKFLQLEKIKWGRTIIVEVSLIPWEGLFKKVKRKV